ncbi:Stage II sporulation protein R [compost metagenome]
MYGGTVYPAGDYEAVRVTLGAGKGQNWWCVLFPPLCFIDAGSGDAAAKGTKTASAAAAGDDGKGGKVAASDKEAVQTVSAAGGAVNEEAEAPKVRFFLWDMLQNLWSWISGLWS